MKIALKIVGVVVLGLLLAIVGNLPVLIGPASVGHAQGPPAAAGQKAYISTNTTTMVKPTNGFLHTVTINGGTAGAVSLYDIAASGCSGTPASGKFATIEAIGATNPTSLLYDVTVTNGLCVVTAAATDVTVSYN